MAQELKEQLAASPHLPISPSPHLPISPSPHVWLQELKEQLAASEKQSTELSALVVSLGVLGGVVALNMEEVMGLGAV